MTIIDLRPAAQRLTGIITRIPDDALGAPTPCASTNVAVLLHHVDGFALAFTNVARKSEQSTDGAPFSDALRDEWRTAIPQQLSVLADAWRDPNAWTGTAKVGGGVFPGELCGKIALGEMLLHGWDLARATGAPFTPSDDELEAVRSYIEPIVTAPKPPPEGLFGPRVEVPEDAPLLDKVLGLSGRDPAWSPTS
jgi:uncharacterized protein (TIGR03086 family)